jgi:hypothetical protein
MEAKNRPLDQWLNRIKSHQIVLPRFQRYEAWSYSQIESLLNTVLSQLPIGALLTLDVDADNEPFKSRPIAGAPATGSRPLEHLLDGQQRLTAFWKSLNDLYPDRLFLVRVGGSEDEESEYCAISVSRYEKNNQKYPIWADSPVELWNRKLIPLTLLRPDAHAVAEAQQWIRQACGTDVDKFFELGDRFAKLRLMFATFNIPFLSLPINTKPDVALEVFVRMNTSSSPLSPYDIVVAQIEAENAQSLHGYIEELKQEEPSVVRYNDPEDVVLAVAALISNRTPSKTTYLSKEFASSFDVAWPKVKKGIKKAISFLSEEKLHDNRRLPTDVVIYVLAALWGIAEEGLDKEGVARTILRKYLWRAFFTERYDRATTSRAYSDYNQISKLLVTGSGSPDLFNSDLYPLAPVEEIISAGWPFRKDRLARAILAISLKSGGIDFADGSPATYETIKSREYHHIFPKSWLRDNGFKEHEINRALNCALITWKTNRKIAAKKPSEYVQERMNASQHVAIKTHDDHPQETQKLDNEVIRNRLMSHLVPCDELFDDDYKAFIEKRAHLVKERAEKLCEGQAIEILI